MNFFLNPVGIIIIINFFVFFFPTIVNFFSKRYLSSQEFLTYGWKENSAIKEGEYYRLITAMFLHSDLLHLVSNMWALFVLGVAFSELLPWLFIIVYFLSGIVGNIFSFLFNPYPSVGASGSIFGLVGFILVQSLVNMKIDGFINLILYSVVSFVLASLPGSRIDKFGHLGGLLTGALIYLLFGVFFL